MGARNPTRKEILETSDLLVRRGQAAVSEVHKTIASTRVIVARSSEVVESIKRAHDARTQPTPDSGVRQPFSDT